MLEGDGWVLVSLREPDRASLLELMLASLLRRRLTSRSARRHARALGGAVAVEAGGMRATLRPRNGGLQITRGSAFDARAHVGGTLAAIVDAATSRRRLAHLARGELSAIGRPRTLWHALALLHA